MWRAPQATAAAAALTLVLTGQALATDAASPPEPKIAGTTPSLRTAPPPVKVPGSLTGLGFDVCTAPAQHTMDELRTRSPYWAVGVYVGGENRTCAQPELTRSWVHTQHRRGWHIVPIWVGLQAPVLHRGTPRERPCINGRVRTPMSAGNRAARRQGISAANRAARNAQRLGMARGSTLFLDVEAYDNTTTACNQPVLNFQSGWSKRLHALGWKSGFYSSAGSGIRALDYVRATYPGAYVLPDAIWIALGNGKANVDGDPYVRDRFWRGQRLHQYRLDVTRRFGDVRFKRIDLDAVDIGRGSVPGKPRHTCGVDLDSGRYLPAGRGHRSPQVKAGQCLLKRHGLFGKPLSGRFDKTTARGVGIYQERRGLPVTRTLNGRTWTSLLSGGTAPLVKRGSAGDRVRFLQRALTAALGRSVPITGVVTGATTVAVKRYQRAAQLPVTGIVSRPTWKALQHGRR